MRREQRKGSQCKRWLCGSFAVFNLLLLFAISSCENPLIINILDPRTVTFESNGGSSVESQTVYKGEPVKRPSDPLRSGYSFSAWYRDNTTFLEEWDFAAPPTGDITLYARWHVVAVGTFTVMFNKNGGDTEASPASRIVESGGLVTPPETEPAREGFEFTGWYKEADCLNVWNFEEDAVTGDITLYAQWEALPGVETRIVTFNSNGGDTDASPHSRTEVYGSLVTAPSTAPTKTGYTFAGWYKEAGCITIWNFDEDTVTADISLYAKWNVNTYTVSFDADGGTPAPDQQTIGYGGKVTEPSAMTKTGFTFHGWYRDAGFTNQWDFENDTVTAITTLYAQWEALPGVETRIVTFNSNGGDTEASPHSRTEVYGSLVTAPSTAPTKTGYTFAGWYKEAGCITIWNFDEDTVTADISLYAKWHVNTYAVSFDADGGTPAPDQQTVDYGGKVTEPSAMTKTGFTFHGWYRDADFINKWNFENDTITAITTLYAQWEALPGVETRIVTFNSNGGDTDASPPSRTEVYGSLVTAPSTAPTRAGYTFAGWYKEEDCLNVWDFATDVVTANITLYAKWAPSQLPITLTLDVSELIEKAPNFDSSITLSRTGNNKMAYFTISGAYTAIAWEIPGVGVYSDTSISGTSSSITLDATDHVYNSPGWHTVAVKVTVSGLQYQTSFRFRIME